MQPDCIRRPDSTWTACRCDPCRSTNARLAKMWRAGMYERPSSDDAWEILAQLVDRGWTPKAVGTATNTPWRRWHSSMRDYATTGIRRALHPSSCLGLFSMGDPTEGWVGSKGTVRRLRALARVGYGLRQVAEGTGVGFSTLADIRRETKDRGHVDATIYVKVRNFYDAHHATPGPSVQAKREAEKKGWRSPAAYDDIDDPAEQPDADNNQGRGRPTVIHDRLEDLEWMADHDEDLTHAAQRLGLKRETIHTICHRANRLDLYWRLANREPDADRRRATRDGMKRGAA